MEIDQERWSRDLERLRPLLVLLARQNINPRLWKDVDPSGVVQETLIEAHKDRSHFQGNGSIVLEGWVRQILLHNLDDAIRKAHRIKRNVDREVSIDAAIGESSSRIGLQIAAAGHSPSEIAMRNEATLALAVALELLEPGQRDAVELHHLQGRSLSESALLLGKSESAVAALLHRGLKKLQELMKRV
jgi:RNA polymerase sigma-70 factor (ECF subfamily)